MRTKVPCSKCEGSKIITRLGDMGGIKVDFCMLCGGLGYQIIDLPFKQVLNIKVRKIKEKLKCSTDTL